MPSTKPASSVGPDFMNCQNLVNLTDNDAIMY